MMDYEKDPQTVFLKDLIFVTVRAWRRILVVAIAFAVVLGAVGVAKGLGGDNGVEAQQAYQSSMANYQTAKAEYDAQINEQQDALANLENSLEASPSQLQRQQDYLEQSILMQIDPYSFYRGTAKFYVDTNNDSSEDGVANHTAAVCALYSNMLDARGLETLANQLQMHRKYLAEVVSVGYEGQILTINVNNVTQKDAEELLKLLVDELKSYHSIISASVEEHKLQLVSSYFYNVMDANLVTKQKTEREKMAALKQSQEDAKASVETAKSELSRLQAERDQLREPTMAVSGGKAAALKKGVIYAFVGAVLGVFVVAAVACVAHIAGEKVYSVRTLRNRVGVKVLGSISDDKKKCAVDRWIDKLEGRCIDEKQDVLAALVRGQCTGNVLVAGSAGTQILESVVSSLERAGVKAVGHGSLLNSVQAVETLRSCDCVLLVEKCGISRYSLIEQEIDMVDSVGKQLLGCVVVDS